jgi:hypothetical protein
MPVLLKIWILASALLCAGGWVLSLLGHVDRIGFSVLLSVIALAAFWLKPLDALKKRRLFRRFKRPAPLLFGIMALVAFLGGALYMPVNVDAYAYRLPRVLHWLAEGRWHWIHSADVRLNMVSTGFDWLSAPLLLLARTERPIFLINFVSYLFLPGLIFSTFKRLGVRKRVAWWWMWLLPSGFCYSMQAGSVASDMFAAVYILAALDFALRARESKNPGDLLFSTLAIALVTGAKQSNLPLGLPWLIAVLPSLRLLLLRPGRTILVGVWACFASTVPTILFNLIYTLNWKGLPGGHDFAPSSPLWGIVGNSAWVAISNLLPPIFPWAGQWNAWRLQFLASGLGAHFRSFEVFGYMQRAAAEQYSGIGCFVLGLLIISSIWACFLRAPNKPNAPSDKWTRLINLAAWVSLFVVLAKIGINQLPRYLAPYYPLLFPLFLGKPGHALLIRRKTWQVLVYVSLLCTIVLLIFSRQRPVWPAQTLTSWLIQKFPGHPGLQKVRNAYSFAEDLRHHMDRLVEKIPPSERLIGYAVRFGDKEPWLWKPLGSRKVRRVLNDDTPAAVRRQGIRYIVVDPTALINLGDRILVNEFPSAGTASMTITEWLHRYNAELLFEQEIRGTPDDPPTQCYLVRLK